MPAQSSSRLGMEILNEIYHFAPQLRGLDLLGFASAIRPVRERLLLGVDQDMPRLLHASGFGGFGITCAPAVGRSVAAEIVDIVHARRRLRDSDNGC